MLQSYNQPTPNPTQKVAAGAIAGSITVVLVYLVQELFTIEIPAEVAAALTTIISFTSSYFTRDKAPAPAIPILTSEK